MPAIGKILIVFASMLVLARLRVQLGLALALGGLALNVLAGLTVAEAVMNLAKALLGCDFWLLMVITVLILEIGRFMSEDRNADEIVSAAERWGGRHGRTCTLMVLPAVIGLIPMPGGALFSAPFVQRSGGEINGSSEWKSAVNYWFRHLWEYWWPLYPGVIIAMSVFEMDAWQFMSVQILYTPVAAVAGYLFLVRPHLERLSRDSDASHVDSRRGLFLLLLLVIVIVSLFTVPFILAEFFPEMNIQLRKLLAMLVGLLVSTGIIFRDERNFSKRPTDSSAKGLEPAQSRQGWKERSSAQACPKMFSSLFRPRSLSVLFSLTGVLIFKALMQDSGLLPVAGDELIRSGIPVIFAVGALPFLAGLVTGLGLGFVGTSFPLVVGLMGVEGSGLTPFATLVLAYGFGYMGLMVSPVHLCFLVTKDYFGASLVAVYRQILPCVISMLAFCVAVHALLSVLAW